MAERAARLPDQLWGRLLENPSAAPQTLAFAAVERWGKQAQAYSAELRATHPEATNRELAGIVKKRFAFLARMEGAAAGIPASLAPVAGTMLSVVPDLGALAWIQSRMVISIAAVYGQDASSSDTAAELLVLQGIYATTAVAAAAIAEAGERVVGRVIPLYLRGASLQLVKQLCRYVGIKFTRVALLRLVPFVSIPISAAVNDAATRSLANRAISFYEIDARRRSSP
jgi:EcsC protein family